MIKLAWPIRQRCSPIGVDLGNRSLKLLQFDATRTQVREAVRWDLPPEPGHRPERREQRLVEALRRAREGRDFRGREVIFSLGGSNLFVQNLRVAQATGEELAKIVHFEALGRLPFSGEEAEVRFLEVGDVKQGDSLRREVILFASHRPCIERLLAVADEAGLHVAAIDVEPAAILRCYSRQFRRDDDQQRRVMFVNMGASSTMAIIAHGQEMMFVKYIELGGKNFDEAVSNRLKLPLVEAAALRRRDSDRLAGERDPEIARSLDGALQPVLDKLAHELSLCLRYYSVTFRGQPVSRLVLGGGEANESIAQWFSARLELPCELGNPLRPFQQARPAGRLGQWDVAAGLALKEVS